MPLKILHTSDIHVGMTYRHYPEEIREKLVEARLKVLEKIVSMAEAHGCHLLVVAGDLFEKQSVTKKELQQARHLLSRFSNGTVCVLPGNHDYLNDTSSLWHTFCQDLPDNLVVLGKEEPVTLTEGEYTITLYPAPCHKKHSDTHNLGWMESIEPETMVGEENHFHIGIAHGALAGISPDLAGQYYTMSLETLHSLPQDLWLLGHTHLPYPLENEPDNARIFNAGTPEPDGMNCRHEGGVWLLQMEESRHVEAKRMTTGAFRYLDIEEVIEGEMDYQRLLKTHVITPGETKCSHTLMRLRLKGYLEEEDYDARHFFYREMAEALAYFHVDDSKLKVRFTQEKIAAAFTEGSLPAVLLQELVEHHDEETAHLAYELIQEVRDHED